MDNRARDQFNGVMRAAILSFLSGAISLWVGVGVAAMLSGVAEVVDGDDCPVERDRRAGGRTGLRGESMAL